MQARRGTGVDVDRCAGNAGAGADLPGSRGAADHSVSARRLDRHAGSHRGAETFRRLEPIGGRREPPRRRRQYRAVLVAQAAPDGHTIVFGGQFMAANATIAPMQGFDPVKDLDPIILVATSQDVLMVPLNSPFHSVKDIIEAAKAHPGELTFASLGVGSSGHLATDAVQPGHRHHAAARAVYFLRPGRDRHHAPAGFRCGWRRSAARSARSRPARCARSRYRAATRAAQLPDVPTFDELGVAYGNDTSWYALFAPAGTPPDVIAKINADTNENPHRRRHERARRPSSASAWSAARPRQLGAHLRSEIDKWAKVAKAAGLEPK